MRNEIFSRPADAAHVSSNTSEDHAGPSWQPPTLRFVGGRSPSTVNSAIIRHVAESNRLESDVCADEEFANAFSKSSRKRGTAVIVFPLRADREEVAKYMRAIFRGDPDEIVFQLQARASERTDDIFGLNYFIELSWRCGHSAERHA